MLTKTRTLIACGAAAAAVGLAGGAAVPALATTSTPSAVAALPTVYQGKIVGQQIVLGPQSNPTVLAQTPRLPGGNYLVTATVGAIIASHDQIVCAAFPVGNDGVFGTAGNPGTGSIYGTAAMTDTVHVAAGERIQLTCNSFNFGRGTLAGDAVLEAIPVGHMH